VTSLAAGLARTLALVVLPALCHAAPPTAAELAKLCANAEDTSHCGRIVEARQLPRLKAFASREGDELRIQLAPTGLTIFRDSVNIIGARTYAIWDYVEDLEALVLFATDGDRSEFWIVERRGGAEFRIPSEPVFAPGHKRFATADFCPDACDNEIAVWSSDGANVRKVLVWKPAQAWTDAGITWKGPESLAVDYRVAGESTSRTMERRLNDATWTRAR
jgi:hypothetical protein